MIKILDNTRLFEGDERAALGDGFKTAGGDDDSDVLVELWNENLALLKVGFSADFATRVKLRRTSAVRVAPPNEGANTGDSTYLCHSPLRIPHNYLVLQCI